MKAKQGASLAELLVSLTILALGGGMSARILGDATRFMEEAEIGLRAALFLSELRDGAPSSAPLQRRAGPGVLIAEGSGAGAAVRFEPASASAVPEGGPGGYRRSRSWSLAAAGSDP